MTECQVEESSRGQMQRPETKDGQQLQDDMQERAAGMMMMMMMMSRDGDDQADQNTIQQYHRQLFTLTTVA